MKNLFIVLLSLITFNSYSNELLDKAKQISTEIVDSTTKAVKETTAFVDTSSNFKMLYTDLKTGLTALAESLKVGAEHVYIILVKQQVVNAITELICYFIFPLILLILSIYLFIYKLKFFSNENLKESEGTSGILGGIVIIGLLLFTLIAPSWDKIIMGFVNPEYGAIMDIINFVKK